MNWDRIAGNWQQLAGAARQQWSGLAGDGAGVVAALRQRSLGKIRAGYCRDEGCQREAARRVARAPAQGRPDPQVGVR